MVFTAQKKPLLGPNPNCSSKRVRSSREKEGDREKDSGQQYSLKLFSHTHTHTHGLLMYDRCSMEGFTEHCDRAVSVRVRTVRSSVTRTAVRSVVYYVRNTIPFMHTHGTVIYFDFSIRSIFFI